LNPDIYISTYDLQYGHHPHIKDLIQDTGDDRISAEAIYEMFKDLNVVDMDVENYEKYIEVILEEEKFVHPSMSLIRSCHAQYRKLFIATRMLEEVEEKQGFKYDFIIKTRPDLIYAPSITPGIFIPMPKTVYVDSGNMFPNDCIIIGNRNDILNISKFMYEEFFHPIYSDSRQDAPHRLLFNACICYKIAIKTMKLMHHVIRRGGKVQYY
jgi:hypothetical protein